ncbi:unnamed protein product [Amoebophrya sp. A25]|nr:unnamed protein product [Amoebophrya sp. A25]|eukprot:GSA25T00010212001.1
MVLASTFDKMLAAAETGGCDTAPKTASSSTRATTCGSSRIQHSRRRNAKMARGIFFCSNIMACFTVRAAINPSTAPSPMATMFSIRRGGDPSSSSSSSSSPSPRHHGSDNVVGNGTTSASAPLLSNDFPLDQLRAASVSSVEISETEAAAPSGARTPFDDFEMVDAPVVEADGNKTRVEDSHLEVFDDADDTTWQRVDSHGSSSDNRTALVSQPLVLSFLKNEAAGGGMGTTSKEKDEGSEPEVGPYYFVTNDTTPKELDSDATTLPATTATSGASSASPPSAGQRNVAQYSADKLKNLLRKCQQVTKRRGVIKPRQSIGAATFLRTNQPRSSTTASPSEEANVHRPGEVDLYNCSEQFNLPATDGHGHGSEAGRSCQSGQLERVCGQIDFYMQDEIADQEILVGADNCPLQKNDMEVEQDEMTKEVEMKHQQTSSEDGKTKGSSVSFSTTTTSKRSLSTLSELQNLQSNYDNISTIDLARILEVELSDVRKLLKPRCDGEKSTSDIQSTRRVLMNLQSGTLAVEAILNGQGEDEGLEPEELSAQVEMRASIVRALKALLVWRAELEKGGRDGSSKMNILKLSWKRSKKGVSSTGSSASSSGSVGASSSSGNASSSSTSTPTVGGRGASSKSSASASSTHDYIYNSSCGTNADTTTNTDTTATGTSTSVGTDTDGTSGDSFVKTHADALTSFALAVERATGKKTKLQHCTAIRGEDEQEHTHDHDTTIREEQVDGDHDDNELHPAHIDKTTTIQEDTSTSASATDTKNTKDAHTKNTHQHDQDEETILTAALQHDAYSYGIREESIEAYYGQHWEEENLSPSASPEDANKENQREDGNAVTP